MASTGWHEAPPPLVGPVIGHRDVGKTYSNQGNWVSHKLTNINVKKFVYKLLKQINMLSKHIFPHYQIFPAKKGSYHDIRYNTKYSALCEKHPPTVFSYIWDTLRRVLANIWGGGGTDNYVHGVKRDILSF